MNILRSGIGFLCILLTTVTCAYAEEDPYCPSNGLTQLASSIATWRAGAVTTGKPALLRERFDASDSTCGNKACFARGGATGVEVRQAGSSVCVGVPQKGKLATMFGWIPSSRWHVLASSPQPAVRWTGVWQNETAKITVQLGNEKQLDIKGHAVMVLDANEARDIYGDFAISGKPVNGVVTGEDDDYGSCKVSVRLLGDYLVAADNGNCGGIDITFTGIYRLRHH